MTFTNEEEEILKLLADLTKKRQILNNENSKMGNAIRAEFKSIDDRIRTEHRPIFTPMQEDVKAAEEALKKRFE